METVIVAAEEEAGSEVEGGVASGEMAIDETGSVVAAAVAVATEEDKRGASAKLLISEAQRCGAKRLDCLDDSDVFLLAYSDEV